MQTGNFIKNGHVVSDEVLNENQIFSLREELTKEFLHYKTKVGNRAGKDLIHFNNTDLIKKIINLYNHSSVQNVINEIKKKYNTEVAVLPTFEVHKNYHVNLKEFHGWHRDCGGELQYNYCKNILGSNDYLLGKIGFYLQKNEDYGGSIDLIKNSHKNFSKYKIIIRKIKSIPLRIVMFFHKYFNKVYNMLPESLFMFFLNAEKLNPKLGSAVFFDGRIIHRGSPIAKKNLNNVDYEKRRYRVHLPEHAPDKFSIYCQIGTSKGVDAYMYDRLRRKGNSEDQTGPNELKHWLQQIEFISKFDKKLSNQANIVFNPIKEKYKEYLS